MEPRPPEGAQGIGRRWDARRRTLPLPLTLSPRFLLVSLIQVIPFRRFRPSEIVSEHGAKLAEWHPTHNHITSAVANVLSWLLRDGVIVKVGTGVYVPSVAGTPLIA